jgi:hypothetical protein
VKCTSSAQARAAIHARVPARAAALQEYERSRYLERKRGREMRDAPREERVALANGRERRAACGCSPARSRTRCSSTLRVQGVKTSRTCSVTSFGTKAGASGDGEARGGRVRKERRQSRSPAWVPCFLLLSFAGTTISDSPSFGSSVSLLVVNQSSH